MVYEKEGDAIMASAKISDEVKQKIFVRFGSKNKKKG